MKKTILISALVLAVNYCTPAYAQSSPQTMSRIRDSTTATSVANVTQLAGTQAAAQYGLNVAAGCYYYSGAQWYSWVGALANSDAVPPATTRAPYVNGLGMYFDGTNWRRIVGEDWDTSMTAAPNNININSFGVFYNLDGTVGRRWEGETYDSSMTAAPVNPGVNSFVAFYNGANSQYWQGSVLSSETTANTTYAPHVKDYTYCYDATSGSWRWVNVIDAQADGQASTLNGMVTSSLGYGFNGSTWDMLRVGASNELQTTDVATRAGEDIGNDWRKVKKEQTAVYAPSYTDTDMASGVETTIFTLEVLSDLNFCVYIKNIDDAGGGAFTDVDFYISPNNSDWIDMGWSTCDTLAFGVLCNYCVSGNAYRYIKVTATSAEDNYARVWYTSNKN